MRGREAVTPTAHHTGYGWVRNGLSHPALATSEGRILFASLAPPATASRLLGGATLESYLLARHRAIDALLDRAIDRDRITQVIELAAGLSPRGWRYVKRYGDRIAYNESLEGLVEQLDRDQGVAIITEGLLGYLSPLEVDALWRRLARILSGFAQGRYISDLYLGASQTWQVRAFRMLLSVFVRGPVYVHFSGPEEAISAVLSAGFGSARIERAAELADGAGDPGASLAHILEASTA